MNPVHVDIWWQNETTPAINDTNLGQINSELATYDSRIITLDTTKANQSDLLTAMADWDVDNATGDVTITLKSGQTITRHTNLGKIAINVRVIHDPTDPHYQEMEITMPDGTKDYVDFSAFVTQFEFVDSSEIHASVNSDGEVSFSLINGSITGAKLQPNYLADVTAQANAASGSATTATNKATLAQSYAVGGTGTRAGEDTDNAKYYKEQAAAIAQQTLSGLTDVTITTPTDGQVLAYDGNSGEWVNADVPTPLIPHLVIAVETGSTVTITKGGTTIIPTETSTGTFEADIPEFGTWTIDAIKGIHTGSATLTVDTVKIYNVSINLLTASITVAYTAGATVTCSLGGTTLTADTNPYTFVVGSTGTWVISAAYSEGTLIENVVITTNGQTESVDMTTTSYVGIQRIVRQNHASDFFDYGDQIEVTYTATDNTEYTMPFDVVSFDDVEITDGTTHHGMWLQGHYTMPEWMPIDAAEPNNANNNIKNYGYNRWSESGARAWLNSAETAGNWWGASFERNGVQVTRRAEDVAPAQLPNVNGFMRGLPADFLAILGEIKVQTACNTVTDSGVTDITHDTFFLPSLEQIYCTPEVSGVEGNYWGYWKQRLGLSSPASIYPSVYSNYIKYSLSAHSTAVAMRVRSAKRASSCDNWYVSDTGYVNNNSVSANGNPHFTPSCVIV